MSTGKSGHGSSSYLKGCIGKIMLQNKNIANKYSIETQYSTDKAQVLQTTIVTKHGVEKALNKLQTVILKTGLIYFCSYSSFN